ncbi:MLO-like protein 3 isoform X2 [Cajanus cajan]|uniref:MLO-like protein n=1 Tax=Cajanus cajan TaxID=3821 RepID=A0A151TV03_CAJCA|nr:MLO-like protein 3 isoform X2 [Cajanus cajan]KYP70856.1 MLO-like protein 3 [Cajanus cajan]
MAAYASGYSLEHTPTWAIALVSFILISISIILEHLIHLIIKWLRKHRKIVEAIERLKSELMILGFMSLLLTVTQDAIIEICIPMKTADTMLPCRKRTTNDTATNLDSCSAKNASKVALVSKHGIHQLHMFVFVLAVMQIVYSFLTVSLARAKMRHWKAWDEETQTIEYEIANDPNRFRYSRQTTFGRRHISTRTASPVYVWIKCFFRQFFHSVEKVDYLTLRHGFISAHFSARNSNFDFQNYIEQSLEEDFRIIVSISPVMWFTVVIFLLVDVHGWHVYLWLSYVPLMLVLVVGAKLEVIVDEMALQMKDINNVTKGTPLVCPSDKLFWFGHPGFVLTLIHYTLFVNAFELAFFIWVSTQFGINSCYHEHRSFTIIRVVIAVAVQVLCSYVTLPLYALVAQMGSQVKSKALAKILKQWHVEVRERRRKQEKLVKSFSFRHRNKSSEWGQGNKSAPEFSSTLGESNRSYDEGEIVEELEHSVKTKASSSSDPPSFV